MGVEMGCGTLLALPRLIQNLLLGQLHHRQLIAGRLDLRILRIDIMLVDRIQKVAQVLVGGDLSLLLLGLQLSGQLAHLQGVTEGATAKVLVRGLLQGNQTLNDFGIEPASR